MARTDEEIARATAEAIADATDDTMFGGTTDLRYGKQLETIIDIILRLAVVPARKAGAEEMRERAAAACLSQWKDEPDITTQNGLSHGCIQSNVAIHG